MASKKSSRQSSVSSSRAQQQAESQSTKESSRALSSESVGSSEQNSHGSRTDSATRRNTLDTVAGYGEAALGSAISGMLDRASAATANALGSSEQDYDTGVSVSVEQIANGSMSASELASIGISGNAEQRAYAAAAIADKQAQDSSRMSGNASSSTSAEGDAFNSTSSKNDTFDTSSSNSSTAGVGGLAQADAALTARNRSAADVAESSGSSRNQGVGDSARSLSGSAEGSSDSNSFSNSQSAGGSTQSLNGGSFDGTFNSGRTGLGASGTDSFAAALSQISSVQAELHNVRVHDLSKSALENLAQGTSATQDQRLVAASVLSQMEQLELNVNQTTVGLGEGAPGSSNSLAVAVQDLVAKVDAVQEAFKAEAEAFTRAVNEGTPEAQAALGDAVVATAIACSELPRELQAAFEASPAYLLASGAEQSHSRQDATAEDVLALRALLQDAAFDGAVAKEGSAIVAQALQDGRLEQMTQQERSSLAEELRVLADAAKEPTFQTQLNAMAASAESGNKAALSELAAELSQQERAHAQQVEGLQASLQGALNSLGDQEAAVLSRVEDQLQRIGANETLQNGDGDTRAQYEATAVLVGALIQDLPAADKLEALSTLEAAAENIKNAKPDSPEAQALANALSSITTDSLTLKDAVELTDEVKGQFVNDPARTVPEYQPELAELLNQAADNLVQQYQSSQAMTAAEAMKDMVQALENQSPQDLSDALYQANAVLGKMTNEVANQAFNEVVPSLAELEANRDVLDATYTQSDDGTHYAVNTPRISPIAEARDFMNDSMQRGHDLESVSSLEAVEFRDASTDVEVEIELDMGGD